MLLCFLVSTKRGQGFRFAHHSKCAQFYGCVCSVMSMICFLLDPTTTVGWLLRAYSSQQITDLKKNSRVILSLRVRFVSYCAHHCDCVWYVCFLLCPPLWLCLICLLPIVPTTVTDCFLIVATTVLVWYCLLSMTDIHKTSLIPRYPDTQVLSCPIQDTTKVGGGGER